MKKQAKQWRRVDMVAAALCMVVFMASLAILTPFGGSLVTSGRQAYMGPIVTDPASRERLLRKAEAGEQLSPCPQELEDHMPCEDPRRSMQLSKERNFYRERHCPPPQEKLLCLIPPPIGYQIHVPFPDSLHKIWRSNMPHSKIAQRKGHQGWMKEQGSYFVFPGGGTMFTEGAHKYIKGLEQYVPLNDGTIRTALDVGCGVASFGSYLFKKKVLTMSFAPRDSHKAQIQFALERGIPAFVAMLGTHKLPFPAHAFDLVHCSRCLISFTAYNGTYLIEMDRLLRPGGYFVLSGPPVNWANQENDWKELQDLTRRLCYELVSSERNTAIWKKPLNNSCLLEGRKFSYLICDEVDDPNSSWYTPLKECISQTLILDVDRKGRMLPKWPERLDQPPRSVSEIQNKDGELLFVADMNCWKQRVKHYKDVVGLFTTPSLIRNVLDMNAVYGGFAAAVISESVWVMNVVPAFGPNTLPVIYDRGLIGVFHDWCEAFSTYPRTYDLIHIVSINSLIGDTKKGRTRCSLVDLMLEIDRMLRPEGTVVIRDSPHTLERISKVTHAIRWMKQIFNTEGDGKEKLLVAKKKFWGLESSS